MGLCPDCRDEGETVAFIGGSKDEVLSEDGNTPEDEKAEVGEEENEAATEICDLCGDEYEVDKK